MKFFASLGIVSGIQVTIVCEDEFSKDNILVRDHFRMAGGRKVYVKTHYRKR